MKNPRSFQHQEPSRAVSAAAKLVYLVFLLAAALAGRYRYKSMEALELVMNYTRSALQLHTMAVIQDMEIYFLELEAAAVEITAEQESTQAKRYSYDSQIEQGLAKREELRAEYFEHLARHDQRQADRAKACVRHDEALYAELIRNMTAVEQEASELKDKNLRPVHQGLCNALIFSTLCNAVEGAVDLQRHADPETMVLQQELLQRRKEALSQRQFMDELVAQALQQKATRYNETSQHLWDVAEHFENQSQVLRAKARAYNESAESLFAAEEDVEVQEEREEEWEKGNISLAEHELLQGERYYKIARLYATVACLLALPAIVFFLARAAIHAWHLGLVLAGQSSATTSRNDDFLRDLSYCILHCVIFLMCIGFVGKLLVNMYYYDWGQRAAIVAWFSFLASLLQVIFLHIMPQFVTASSGYRMSADDMFTHGVTHGVLVLFCLFGIEFLFLWVSFGPWLLWVVGPVGHWLFRLLAITLLIVHLYIFEPDSQASSVELEGMILDVTKAEETSQVTNSWDTSESTPLTGTSPSSISTNSVSSGAAMLAFALMDLRPHAYGEGNVRRAVPKSSLSDLYNEFCRLHLPFELLVVACSIKVFFDSVQIAWQYTVLFSAVLMLLVTIVCTWQGLRAWTADGSVGSATVVLKEKVLTSFIELQHV